MNTAQPKRNAFKLLKFSLAVFACLSFFACMGGGSGSSSDIAAGSINDIFSTGGSPSIREDGGDDFGAIPDSPELAPLPPIVDPNIEIGQGETMQLVLASGCVDIRDLTGTESWSVFTTMSPACLELIADFAEAIIETWDETGNPSVQPLSFLRDIMLQCQVVNNGNGAPPTQEPDDDDEAPAILDVVDVDDDLDISPSADPDLGDLLGTPGESTYYISCTDQAGEPIDWEAIYFGLAPLPDEGSLLCEPMTLDACIFDPETQDQ